MPDGEPATIGDPHQSAVAAVGMLLHRKYSATELKPGELSRFGNGVSNGWSLEVGETKLQVLLDGGFPYNPPIVALPDESKILVWPHVEAGGKLCVMPPQTTTDALQATSVVEAYVSEAVALIGRCERGENIDDFKTEFLSYWELSLMAHAPLCRSVVAPNGPSRIIRVWRAVKNGVRIRTFADTDEELSQWLEHSRVGKNAKIFQDAILLWCSQPLLPNEYPSNAADIATMLRASGLEADVLDKMNDSQSGLDVLIGAPSSNGTCFAVFELPALDVKGAQKGFRPGRVPPERIAQFAQSATRPGRRGSVTRADKAWIHGRDRDPAAVSLSEKLVTVVGCGALGGSIARILAQSGIGSFHLIDGRRLGAKIHPAVHWVLAGRGGTRQARYAKSLLKCFLT